MTDEQKLAFDWLVEGVKGSICRSKREDGLPVIELNVFVAGGSGVYPDAMHVEPDPVCLISRASDLADTVIHP